MTPISLRETLAFVAHSLSSRRRVLEVGCGDGSLAGLLASAGHDVVAIDTRLRDTPRPALVRFEQVDLLRFTSAQPFDAVLAVTVLHHLTPLEACVARLHELLVPGGLLVVDDFDLAAPDEATARWYYDAQDLLAVAGRFPTDAVHGAASEPPLERWHHEHEHHDEPLHTRAAMLAALDAGGFDVSEVTRGPYLFRYLGRGVTEAHDDTVSGERVAEHLLTVEQRHLKERALQPVGLRILAHRR
ncbi:class I SAM-dependent methyltransferase [Myxococcus qinghaiensis]|uniref:class I SAM-dependent methyltransferase n=1 Tax=Myxococcus qinghaiensis TaxID=2906758 RepID=UPI0020A7C22C|nr:class I SAM-dependent methyltransferase [Myxococcus qinghaiensis]MCP3166236.1 class I SAM-dependent methyltransferase [Myxococcus qinghaiensis]